MTTQAGEPANNGPGGDFDQPSTKRRNTAILWAVAGLGVLAVAVAVIAAGGDGGAPAEDDVAGAGSSPSAHASHGDHGAGHSAHPEEPASTVPAPPQTSPGPAVDAALANVNPVSNVDARAMMDAMASDWKVGWGETPADQYTEVTEQKTAILTDEVSGLVRRVTVSYDRADGKLRRLVCNVVDTNPANGNQVEGPGRQHLIDCATRGVEGADSTALQTWMDTNLAGPMLVAAAGNTEPLSRKGGLPSGVQVEAVNAGGLTLTILGSPK